MKSALILDEKMINLLLVVQRDMQETTVNRNVFLTVRTVVANSILILMETDTASKSLFMIFID